MPLTFSKRTRLAFYVAWLPLTAVVAVLLSLRGLSGLQSVVVSFVFAVPFSLVSGSAYYMCRALPLRRTRIVQVLPSLIGASIAASGIWGAVFFGISFQLNWLPFDKLSAVSWLLFGLGTVFFLFSLGFHYLIIALEDIRKAERQAHDARILSREAELRALRAQLNPHFLYNSLNSIAALTLSNGEGARDMVVLLSDFLRTTVALGNKERVTLAEELALTRSYLDIERVRFSERLTVFEQVDDSLLKIWVPPLLLQPLVENAVKHGLSSDIEANTIGLFVAREDAYVVVSVENQFDSNTKSRKGVGMGLQTTQERMLLFYGDRSKLVINKKENTFKVSVWIPIN